MVDFSGSCYTCVTSDDPLAGGDQPAAVTAAFAAEDAIGTRTGVDRPEVTAPAVTAGEPRAIAGDTPWGGGRWG